MSDRCNVSVKCHEIDKTAIIDEFGEEPEEFTIYPNFLSSMYFQEMNYGAISEITSLVSKGIPFIGDYTAGDEYGPGRFCSINREYHEIEVDRLGDLYISADKRGNPKKASINKIKKYLSLEKKAFSEIKKRGPK